MNTTNKNLEVAITEKLDRLLDSKEQLVNDLVEKGEEASFNESLDSLLHKAGNYVPKTYLIVDDQGYEIPAVLVETETVFDATENDVRLGKTFISDTGPKVGTKIIPTYHTEAGYTAIPNGKNFAVSFIDERYDYTNLQAILCPYNKTIANSVAADKVVINDGVYAVNSTELITTVTKDSENKTIDLGIANNSGRPYVLRYFTYKEIY